MHRPARLVRRLALLLASSALLASVCASVAFAAPVVSEAAFTNPVAYELKSLLTTRFYVKSDVDGWATLTVSGASGVVKTVYSGPVKANTRLYTPAWNGMSSAGKRLPSASYDWTLTVNKGTARTVKTGKITISKINFNMTGTDKGSFSRYMLPGTANIYATISSNVAGQCSIMNTKVIGASSGPMIGGPVLFSAWVPYSIGKTSWTGYLRSPAVPSRAMYPWSVTAPHSTVPPRVGETPPPAPVTAFYITVIQ